MRSLFILAVLSSCLSSVQENPPGFFSYTTKDSCRLMTSWGTFDWSELDTSVVSIFYLPTQYCDGPDCYVMIAPECPTLEFELIIFNRWGEVQFETTSRGDYWNAGNVESGAYLYRLSGIYLNGNSFKYHARFDLARAEKKTD